MATTHVDQDNITLVRRGFEAFASGDMATLAELFDPAATWGSPPMGVLGGELTGRDAVFAMFATIGRETNGSFAVVPRTFAATGAQVFVNARASGTRQGRALDADEILVFSLTDGTVRDVRLYFFDYPANLAFWS